jgi:hypothetical protein
MPLQNLLARWVFPTLCWLREELKSYLLFTSWKCEWKVKREAFSHDDEESNKKYENDATFILLSSFFHIHSHRFSTFIQNRISLLRNGNFSYIIHFCESFEQSALKFWDFFISSFATTYFTLLLHSRRVMKNIFEKSFSSYFSLSLKWFSFNFIRFCSVLAIALSNIMKSEVKWKWFSSIQKDEWQRRQKRILVYCYREREVILLLLMPFHYALCWSFFKDCIQYDIAINTWDKWNFNFTKIIHQLFGLSSFRKFKLNYFEI